MSRRRKPKWWRLSVSAERDRFSVDGGSAKGESVLAVVLWRALSTTCSSINSSSTYRASLWLRVDAVADVSLGRRPPAINALCLHGSTTMQPRWTIAPSSYELCRLNSMFCTRSTVVVCSSAIHPGVSSSAVASKCHSPVFYPVDWTELLSLGLLFIMKNRIVHSINQLRQIQSINNFTKWLIENGGRPIILIV